MANYWSKEENYDEECYKEKATIWWTIKYLKWYFDLQLKYLSKKLWLRSTKSIFSTYVPIGISIESEYIMYVLIVFKLLHIKFFVPNNKD